MAKGGSSGPNRGGKIVVAGAKMTTAASQTNVPIPFVNGASAVTGFTMPAAMRLIKVHVRCLGTGGLTKVSLRKTANQAALPVIGDTAIGSSDSITVAANSQQTIYPATFAGVVPNATSEGDTIASATISTRDFAKNEQFGVFFDTDATVGNRDVYITATFFVRGHAYVTQGSNEVD